MSDAPERAGTSEASGVSGSPTSLIGRHAELDQFRDLLDPQSPGALIVTGDPGIGKTALLAAAEQLALSSGHQVLRCAGAEFESDIAYAGLNQLLFPIAAEFVRISPAQQDALAIAIGMAGGPTSGELVVVSALRALLGVMAETAPVVLIVDDLQWLDRMTATVLGLLARRLGGSGVAIIAAQRNGELNYFAAHDLPAMHVGPLTVEEGRRLLAAHFPNLSDQHREAALEQAQGNPLALSVLPQVLQDNGVYAGEWPLLPLSRRITETFSAHISRLPPPTRTALLAIALDATGGASALAIGDQLTALDAAEQAGIVVFDRAARRVTFAHPLMGVAVVELATARQRRDAHRGLAAVVTDPVRRAWHLFHAALEPDEGTAAELEHAARIALRRADVVGAVTLLTHSAELTPTPDDKARRLISAARVAGEVAGQLDEASTLIDTARTLHTGSIGSLSEATAGAQQLMNSGGALDAARLLVTHAIDTYVQRDGFASTNAELIEALNVLCVLAWAGGDDAAWEPVLCFLPKLGPDVPELLAISVGLLRDPARTGPDFLPRLKHMIVGLTRDADPLHTVRVAKAAVYVDRIGECRDALWRVVDDGRHGGAVASAMSAITSLCVDDWLTGDWDELAELAAEVSALGDAHGYRRYQWIVVGYLDALAAVVRGRDDSTATEAIRTAEWASARGSGIARQFLHHVHALSALGRGDFSSAYDEVSAVINPGQLPIGSPHALWMLLDFTEAAQRSGHHAEAAAHVQALQGSAISELSPRSALAVAASIALVADVSEAADLYERALGIAGAEHFRFEYARVQLLFGEHLRRVKAQTQARTHLQAALASFEELGAVPWQARAEVELQATGTRRRRSPGQAVGAALTPQEREIAQLAASGLSNKEIGQRLVLSPRTVGVHLYRLFPKLGITSRAALRDALERTGER